MGELTELVANKGQQGKFIGIDASKGMIEQASRKQKDNLKFYTKDINNLNYHKEFDIIFSNSTLHWIKGHKTLLENCYTALKNGGIIRFDFAGDGNCQNLDHVLKQVMNKPLFKDEFEDFEWPWFMPKKDEYLDIAEQSGFESIEVWKENADRYFSKEGLIQWIEQPCLVPFLEALPKNKKKEFRATVVEKMLESTEEGENKYFETFRRLNIKAEKS